MNTLQMILKHVLQVLVLWKVDYRDKRAHNLSLISDPLRRVFQMKKQISSLDFLLSNITLIVKEVFIA